MPEMPAKPQTIILVEDDLGHAELIMRGYQYLGIKEEIRHFADGQVAMDHLVQYSIDGSEDPLPGLVILDLRVPSMTGLEILEEMKTRNYLKTIPVVILSTSNAEQDKSRARELGADGYFTKSWSYEEFRNILAEIHHRWLG